MEVFRERNGSYVICEIFRERVDDLLVRGKLFGFLILGRRFLREKYYINL